MDQRCAVYYDPLFLRHDTGAHPENRMRLDAIVTALKTSAISHKLAWKTPGPATIPQIERIHDPSYVATLKEAIGGGERYLDADTVVSSDSWEAALVAAGAVCDGVDYVLSGEGPVFCAVRPPGHHAERGRAMGFCLFNNVAVAARYAQCEKGIGKVAIVDFDVHHGNGTQNSFYDDGSVFYISMHQWPHYPGSGLEQEAGRGEGAGATLNVPLPAGSGDSDYRVAFERKIIPALRSFGPELLIISAGFDAHESDPLSQMGVTNDGYAEMTSALVDLAGEVGARGIVSALEGGYNIETLGQAVVAHVGALLKE